MVKLNISIAMALILLPIGLCQTFSEINIMVPAVSEQNGVFVGIPVRLNIKMITPGTGEVFVNTRALTEMDMQGSARVAAMVACETTGEDVGRRDFLITLYANTTIIGGPSAGGAMTVAMIALLKGLQLRGDVMMTGMITPDGALGVVGGIPEKAYAAYLSGARYFLIPEGQAMSFNSTTYETVNVTEFAWKRWNLTVVEISEVAEAVTWFTGFQFEPSSHPSSPVFTEHYQAMMRDQSWRELEHAASSLESAETLLAASNLTEALGQELESELEASSEALRSGYDAYNRSRFYVASSKAFQSRISSRSVSYSVRYFSVPGDQAEAVIEQIFGEVEWEIACAETALNRTEAHGIDGLECLAAAQSRVQEARNRLQDSRSLHILQMEESALFGAAYAAERAYTARIWSNMTSFSESRLVPKDEDLKDMAENLVADASILATYADLLFDEIFGLPIDWVVALLPELSFIDPYESLGMAQQAVDHGKWTMAAFEAVESEVRSSIALEFINVLVLAQDDEEMMAVLEAMANKSKAKAHIAIEESRNIGVEPVLSVSRFEFSDDLLQADEISALGEAAFGFRFARTAAKLSSSLLDLYRPRLEFAPLNGSIMVLNFTVAGQATDPNQDALMLKVALGSLEMDLELFPGPFSVVVPTGRVPDGTYMLSLNLTDGTLYDCVSFQVTVDNHPPTVLLSGLEDGTAYGHRIRPDLSAWDAADPHPLVEAELDGVPYDLGEVASQGKHVLAIRAEDRAGWSTELTVTFWIDLGKPLVELVYPAGNQTYAPPSLTVRWSSSDNLTGVVRSDLSLDGGRWIAGNETNRTPFGEGWTSFLEMPLNASEGSHRLSIRALDAAGNQQVVTLQVVLDGSPPEVGFSGVADAGWYNSPVSVHFWASDVLDPNPAVAATLDGTQYAQGAPIDAGRHGLVVNASDSAGNQRSVTVSFVVDYAPPRIGANVTDKALFNRTVWIHLWAEDDLDPSPAVEVQIDGKAYFGQELPEGLHTLNAIAKDRAGNAASLSASFTVDMVPPNILASVDNGRWYGEPQAVTVRVEDDLDPNPTSRILLDGLEYNRTLVVGEGGHELFIAAWDWAGNARESRLKFFVDQTPPRIKILGVANDTFYRSAIAPRIGVEDALDPSPNLSCFLDGEGYLPGAKIGDGKHSLLVVATDRVRNSRGLLVNFVVDTIRPQILTDIKEGGEYRGAVTPRINATDEGGSVALDAYLDGKPYKLGSKIGPGVHTLQLVATDRAGNIASLKLVFTVRRGLGLWVVVGIALAALFYGALLAVRRFVFRPGQRRRRLGL